MYEISWEPLNGFVPNSQGRRVWSLAQMSLKVKVNFGGLRAVYVWKNIFALIHSEFICWVSIAIFQNISQIHFHSADR